MQEEEYLPTFLLNSSRKSKPVLFESTSPIPSPPTANKDKDRLFSTKKATRETEDRRKSDLVPRMSLYDSEESLQVPQTTHGRSTAEFDDNMAVEMDIDLSSPQRLVSGSGKEHWVTLFGFTNHNLAVVLREFAYTEISYSNGNYVHLR